jgi:branched-chain amino acid transport system ATP-binding protein
MTSILTLSRVGKTFGGVHAVHDVSMSINAGEVCGLIGPNGAGKSTLVNLISGVLSCTQGQMQLADQNIDRLNAHERARHGIARTFQNLRIFPSLSVAQNIDVARYAGQQGALAESAIEVFDLADKLSQPAGTLSYGHLRRLEIVRALALDPKVLMLDEPAAGMNEQETEALAKALEWIRSQSDCALLVIDHDLRFIMSLCERIVVLNMGELIAEGTPEDITRNQTVIDAYLGEHDEHAA